MKNTIEPISYLWHKILEEKKIPKNGTIVEIAPGYEPKIGNALALLGFCGTIYVVEPDIEAANYLKGLYEKILPKATCILLIKPLEEIVPGLDIPPRVDALLASHPFDDMVIATIIQRSSFFTEEKEDGNELSGTIKDVYESIHDEEYSHAILETVAGWKKIIESLQPYYVIASQYPSQTLTIKGLVKRQNSGYKVLDTLKEDYSDSLSFTNRVARFGFKGDGRWWLAATFTR